MIVIIDAPEFAKNPYAEGMRWSLLHQWTGGNDIFLVNTRRPNLHGGDDALILVPKIVIDEAVQQFRNTLQLEAGKLGRDLKHMARLLPQHADWKYPTIHLDEAAKEYRVKLVQRLAGLGIEQPTHDGVVLASSERSIKGSIICQLAIEYLEESDESVAIITNNSCEFGLPGRLALGLAADLEKKQISPARLQIHRSLGDFVKKHVIPRMEGFKKLLGNIQEDKHPKFKLTDFIRNYHDVLEDWVTEMVEDWHDCPGFLLPHGYHSPQLANLSEDGEINLMDAYRMDNGELMLFLYCYVDGIVTCKKDGAEISEEKQARFTFDFDFSIVLDPKEGTVQDFDLGSTHGFRRWPEDWPQENQQPKRS